VIAVATRLDRLPCALRTSVRLPPGSGDHASSLNAFFAARRAMIYHTALPKLVMETPPTQQQQPSGRRTL